MFCLVGNSLCPRTITDVRPAELPASIAAISFGVVVAAQIALPLADGQGAGLTTAVVVGLTVTTFLVMAGQWRTRLLVLGIVLGSTLVVEAVGVSTGWPFGDYRYTGALQPTALGVPVIVPMAWFAMGVPAWAVGRRIAPTSRPTSALIGGLALMAWDLFLDPQMTEAGYWRWSAGNAGYAWQGIPLVNFAGWWVSGSVVCAAVEGLLGRRLSVPVPVPRVLTVLYAWMVGMATLGFLLPFVFDRPVVGLVGAALALPLAALGVALGPSKARSADSARSRSVVS